MCLIIHKPAAVTFTDDWLRDFYSKNRDGYGFMYAVDGKLHIHKSLGKVERFVESFRERETNEMIIHLRMRTHGDIDLDNCHPYEVLTATEGQELGAVWMVHNGILTHGNSADTKKSDTWHYIRNYLAPILRESPNLLFNPSFQKLITSDIGGSNKFAFMTSSGKSVILNKSAGVEWMGAWMSNTYAWDAHKAGAVKSYFANRGGYQHAHTSGFDDEFGYGYTVGQRTTYVPPASVYAPPAATSTAPAAAVTDAGTIISDELPERASDVFALLKQYGFEKAYKILTIAEADDALRLNKEAMDELAVHILSNAFVSFEDDEFVIDYMRDLAAGGNGEAITDRYAG